MSKFKVGDKVIYNGFLGQYKSEIFGISKKDVKGGKYAITVKGNLDYINLLVEEEDLQLAEIEVGDIVKTEYGSGEVVFVASKKDVDGRKIALIDTNYKNKKAEYYIVFNIRDLKLIEKGGN